MSAIAAMAVSVVWAGPVRLDLSSQVPSAESVAVHTAEACHDQPDEVLAMAVVIYGRRPGRSGWGHISLRFLACEAGDFRDVEFEATRIDATLIDWYDEAFPGEGWYHLPDFLKTQHDRLVLFRNERPVDGGTYQEELDKNREVTELWLPIDRTAAHAILTDLDTEHDAQLALLRTGRTVERPRYKPFSTNCTLPIHRATLAAAPDHHIDSPYPLTWLRRLEDDPTVRIAVHPSPHVLRRIEAETGDLKAAWSGAPTRVFRPLIRRRLDADTLDAYRARVSEDAEPLGVMWALEDRSERAQATAEGP